MIARKIDSLGVDILEAGSAITSDGERTAIKKIAGEGLNAEICSYCRIRREDIDSAISCDVDSIHLVVPVSDLHIQQKLKKDRKSVLGMAVEMTEYAKSHGLVVELSGEDASRADLDYLKSVYNAGIEAGADRLCFCDTVGILTPERSYDIFSDLSLLGAPISVHCHNDFGMATSNTVAALRAGAAQAHVTINGIGERAGNTSLEEVVMALFSLYKHKTKIDLKGLYTTSRLVSRLCGIPVAPNKAIVGGNAFTHEAGIHVHGLLANTATYEPITPELVGRERRIVLGKHAGRSSVVLALRELGFSASEEQIDDIVTRMKELGDKGKHVTDADLQTITETVLGIYQEAKVRLEELTVVAGNTVMPTASIRLKVNGNHVVEAGVGTGPVDAAINALKKAVSGVADIQLDEYHVDAITGGTDALVEVWVKLSKGGKTITARGARTDIIMASVEAVLEGVNRLIQQEQNNRKNRDS
ncbi:isopropylmalate/citramalate/homocitrate synthase [Candidatus Methanoperedens nitroreducens]|uniref:Putative (R)-citramalate synthase CimA n=1 Tax=Candidatus Methanoperedens nitratireducens TaxID=1392998 RepID=A0A062VC76_9EURY|nr:isopropylmalate/citramalate/homocitrate synthase [Candidatus Methanoperedens nitroreducens]